MKPLPPVLELDRVRRRFGALIAVDGVSLCLAAGQTTVVTGPSGSGKSTLLHLSAGLDRPEVGRVLIQGRDIARLGEAARARLRGDCIGLVFQHHLLPPGVTARDAVALPLVVARDMTAAGARRHAERLLGELGMEEFAGQRVERLSGGQRQRVAVARALAPRPALLLADEPTAHLDPVTADGVIAALRAGAAREGSALLVVTHEQRAEDWGASEAYRMEAGRLALVAASA